MQNPMFNNSRGGGGRGDVGSGLTPHFRDFSSSCKLSDHATADIWEREASLRDKINCAERDKYTSANSDLSMVARASSNRSSHAVFSNVESSGPSAKRRVLGRHAPIHENGRYGIVVGRSLESISHVRLPSENGKAERDVFSSTGGPSGGCSSSPGTENAGKEPDGGHSRSSQLSPCEIRPASSPRFDKSPQFDPLGKIYRTQIACNRPGRWEHERSKFSSPSTVRDMPYRDREKAWGRSEYHRRTYSLPKLDSLRDWSAGGRELFEGRIDRYGSASSKESAISDASSISSKERSRYDWRTRDRSLFVGFSSHSSTCAPSNNSLLKDTIATPARLEEPRPKSPPGQLASQSSLLTQQNSDIDAGPTSPKKRPRLTWGQGLAKYEKEKIEDHITVKKCEGDHDGLAESPVDMHASLDCQSRLAEHVRISRPHNQHIGHEQGAHDTGNWLFYPHTKLDTQPSTNQHCGQDLRAGVDGGVLESSLTPPNLAFGFQSGILEYLEDQSKAEFKQSSLEISSTESMSCAAAAPQPSILHKVQVFLSNVVREGTKLSKDVLTHHVEIVEQEIDRLEKELIKLGIDQVEEIMSSHDPPNVKIEVYGGQSYDMSVSASEFLQRHSGDSSDIVAACDEALPMLQNDSIHSQCVEALRSPQMSQEAIGRCDGNDTVIDMKASAEYPGKLQSEGGQVISVFEAIREDKDVGLVESILLSNLRTAHMSLASLAHLYSPKVATFQVSGKLYDSPQQAEVWSWNAEIHSRKRKHLQAKIVEEKASIKFLEKVLAVKFSAYREACKQKQSGGDFRMEGDEGSKMLKGHMENNTNHSLQQSCFRLRNNSVPMVRNMENEEFQTSHLLKSGCSSKLERGFLKMPAMHLGSRERKRQTFDTENGLVDDPVSAEQERKFSNPWSREEKKLFLEKYSLFGKDFRRIAAHLEHKTVADCVEFYYRNQKTDEFEKVRQKHRLEKHCRIQLERHNVERSAFYVTTSPSFSSRHQEGDSDCLEGLTLVAAAAAAMSTPTKPTYRGLATQACIKVAPTHFAVKGVCNVDCKSGRSAHSRGWASNEDINVDWSDIETQTFLDALVLFGKDFDRISQHMGSRSAWQCRSFFSKARRQLGLDQLIECHEGISQASRIKNGTCAPFPKHRNPKPDSGEEAVSHSHSVVIAEPLDVNCDYREARGSNVLDSMQEIGNGVSISPKTSTLGSVSHIPDDQIKQEACTISDSGDKSFGDASTPVSSSIVGNAPMLDSVKDCKLEDILVCGETLHFKAELASVKAETAQTASGICNGGHTDVNMMSAPLGASSAVSTSVAPNPIIIGSAVESTQRKDRAVKVMETKVRREPTSWTQEEKNKFVEVLKAHGKNWDRLRESLPGKSLTQIKTYFQNSKAKLAIWTEGAVNANGRVSSSRKRKVDDSDSSSNAGFGVHHVSQKVAVYTDDGNHHVTPSGFVSSGGIASHALATELPYANLSSRNMVEDIGIAQKISQSIGLNSGTLVASIIPSFNPSVCTPNRHFPQLYRHPNSFQVQPSGLQQSQHATTPLVVVQPLQQQVGSLGVHEMHPPQQPTRSQSTTRVLQDLPLPVPQHSHNKPAFLQLESKQEALQHQHEHGQQVMQHLQRQVSEAVLQQHLPTHFLQRQQLQMLAQQVPHSHFQQTVSQHQHAQGNQQALNQVVSQLPQGTNQNPGMQLACGSQLLTSKEQLQQQGELFTQLYQMHSKSLPLLQQQQQQQLQQLQLHWQQQQAHPELPAKQAHKQISHLQPLNASLLSEEHQQLAVLRGTMQVTNSCADALKQSNSSNGVSSMTQYDSHEDLHQPPSVLQGIQISTEFEAAAESQTRPTDVKLFGQSLLSQPASSAQQQSNVTMLTSQSASSAPMSTYAEKSVTSQLLADAVLDRPVVNCHSSIGASNGGASSGNLYVEPELSSVQQGLARTNERLIRGAKTNEVGQANEGPSCACATVHTSTEQAPSSKAMCSMLPRDLKRPESDGSSGFVQGSEKSAKKHRLQDFQSPSLVGQRASHGLPRVLDALVALAEWRLQNANGGSGKLMDEFLSQSWEALQRDPGSLVEAGKAGGSLAQFYAGNVEIHRHLKDGFSSLQPSMHLLAGVNGGGICASSDGLSQPSSLVCVLNGEHDMRDFDGRSVVG